MQSGRVLKKNDVRFADVNCKVVVFLKGRHKEFPVRCRRVSCDDDLRDICVDSSLTLSVDQP